MRYFWWAEFQKRGALHYHAILVDPPFSQVRDARHWFDKHWAAALPLREHRTQCYVEFREAEWFRKHGGDYVLKDLRKLNGKQYEQDYSRMPRGWRTFRSHQLKFEAAEHQEHESKAHTVCTARVDAPWHERQRSIYVYRVDRHVPAQCGCVLTRPKRRRGQAHDVRTSSKKLDATGRNNLVSTRGTNGLPTSEPTSQRTAVPEVASRVAASRPTTGGQMAFAASTGGVERAFPSTVVGTELVFAPPGRTTARVHEKRSYRRGRSTA
jgi:hypothetical protein